jgi:tetratricopeptide (TPR) repeat protein
MTMEDKTYCDQGDEYRGKGLYEMAIAQYTKAIEKNPKYHRAYTSRGLVYCLHIHDLYEEAFLDFSKAIELCPCDPLSFHGRGLVHYIREDYDAALSDFSRVLELNPKWSVTLYRINGEIYLKTSQFNKAVVEFTKAIEFNPDQATIYRDRALALFHLKEYERALQDVRIAQQMGVTIDCSDLDPDSLMNCLLKHNESSENQTGQGGASIISFSDLKNPSKSVAAF